VFDYTTARQKVIWLLLCLQAAPEGVAFERDVAYGDGDELKLNLARPQKQDGRVPCVVVIHGGGWAGGSREAHDDITWKFAQRGYVSATLGYRLAPKHRFPAAVDDVQAAVRFLRANAEKYGIDPDRIGAIGFSAGGHLAMMLGVMDPGEGPSGKVNAVVSFFGPTDLAAEDLSDESKRIVATFVEKPEDRAKASPLTYVTQDDPPIRWWIVWMACIACSRTSSSGSLRA
jgi:acetyl esterase/lipase